MKTAEEIIKPVLSWTYCEGDEWEMASKGDIINAMQEYADQQSDYWEKRCKLAEIVIMTANLDECQELRFYDIYKEWRDFPDLNQKPK